MKILPMAVMPGGFVSQHLPTSAATKKIAPTSLLFIHIESTLVEQLDVSYPNLDVNLAKT